VYAAQLQEVRDEAKWHCSFASNAAAVICRFAQRPQQKDSGDREKSDAQPLPSG